MLKKLVVGNRDRSSAVGCGIRAFRSQWASAAGLGREFDFGAEDDGLLFSSRARDGAIAHIDLEGVLAEVVAVLSEPRTADDGAASRKDLVDNRRVDVSA